MLNMNFQNIKNRLLHFAALTFDATTQIRCLNILKTLYAFLKKKKSRTHVEKQKKGIPQNQLRLCYL